MAGSWREQPIITITDSAELGRAGRQLLEDPTKHALILRGLGETCTEALLNADEHIDLLYDGGEKLHQEIINILYDTIPQMAALDESVTAWSREHLPPGWRQRGNRLKDAFLTDTYIDPHIDLPFDRSIEPDVAEGPLTFSLRVDSQPVRRQFGVFRPTQSVLTAAGGLDQTRTKNLGARAESMPMTARNLHWIDQGTGDMVIFANFPGPPTIHCAHELTKGGTPNISERNVTRAIIGTYEVGYPG